jgi:hypothetical protein
MEWGRLGFGWGMRGRLLGVEGGGGRQLQGCERERERERKGWSAAQKKMGRGRLQG